MDTYQLHPIYRQQSTLSERGTDQSDVSTQRLHSVYCEPNNLCGGEPQRMNQLIQQSHPAYCQPYILPEDDTQQTSPLSVSGPVLSTVVYGFEQCSQCFEQLNAIVQPARQDSALTGLIEEIIPQLLVVQNSIRTILADASLDYPLVFEHSDRAEQQLSSVLGGEAECFQVHFTQVVSSLQDILRSSVDHDINARSKRALLKRLRYTHQEHTFQHHQLSSQEVLIPWPKTDAIVGNIFIASQRLRALQDCVETLEEPSPEIPLSDSVDSIRSADTEVLDQNGSLKFIPVAFHQSQNVPLDQIEDALLDTGTTACCVSEELALDLGLRIESVDANRTIGTALRDQTLFPSGTSKLRFTWTDEFGRCEYVKLEVYVIKGLALPVILSNEFIDKRPHVWNVAKKSLNIIPGVNLFGIWKPKIAAGEVKYQNSQSRKNRRRDEETAEREREELLKQVGLPPTHFKSRKRHRERATALHPVSY